MAKRGGKAARKPRKVKPLPKKAGRPSKFKPEFLEQATKLTELGATDVEIAAFFKISEKTLNTWKVTVPGFLQSLRLGKDSPDNRVEASLYRRAMGYSHDAVKIVIIEGKVVKVPYVEKFPPDPTSCIFWLKNRRASTWRDVQGRVLETPPGKPVEVKTYVADGPELLQDYYARLASAAIATGVDPAAARDLGPGRLARAEPDGDPDPVPAGPILSPR